MAAFAAAADPEGYAMQIDPRRILGAVLMATGAGIGLAGLAGYGPQVWMYAAAGLLVVVGGGFFADPNRMNSDLGLD